MITAVELDLQAGRWVPIYWGNRFKSWRKRESQLRARYERIDMARILIAAAAGLCLGIVIGAWK